MTYLTESRDALAKALREIPVVWETETHKAVKFLLDHDDAEFVADALIASGAVIDASTLADVAERVGAWLDTNWKYVSDDLGRDLRALVAAITERSQR